MFHSYIMILYPNPTKQQLKSVQQKNYKHFFYFNKYLPKKKDFLISKHYILFVFPIERTLLE